MPVDRNEPAPVNPLDMGNDANSVESAAAEFTRLLEEEIPDKGSRRTPVARASARRSEQSEDEPDERRADPDDEAPDPDRSGDSQRREEPDERDPILDADPHAPEDDEGDDKGDDDEGEPGQADDDADFDISEHLDREIEVMVNGEPVTVPLKEALAGYSREADYRQKTTRLSEERQEVEEFAETVVAKAQNYDAQLQTFIDLAAAFEPSAEDWNKIKASSPEAYIQTKEQWDAVQANVAKAKAERERLAAEQAEINNRQYEGYVRRENAELFKKVPALSNPKKADEFRKKVASYASKAGYTREEIMGTADHRNLITLYKAARFDEIVASRKAGQRPPKEPRQSSTTQPRSVQRNRGNSGNTSRVRDAERRLARSGSVEHAAEAFTEMLKL